MISKNAIARCFALIATAALLTGCMSFQPIEPVKNPPLTYRFDTTVPVEFVAPTKVGFRCAERGAKFLMMPGINSQACASPDLITMPNPCMTVTGGWYAAVLCHELAHANGWAPSHEGGNWVPDYIKYKTNRPTQAQIDQILAEREAGDEAEVMTVAEKESAAPALMTKIESVDENISVPDEAIQAPKPDTAPVKMDVAVTEEELMDVVKETKPSYETAGSVDPNDVPVQFQPVGMRFAVSWDDVYVD